MPLRRTIMVWLLSLSLSGVLGLLFFIQGSNGGSLAWMGTKDAETTRRATTVFIGSSLSGAAIPPRPVIAGQNPGEHAIRRWMPLMTSSELEQQIQSALAAGAHRLFIELRPMTLNPDVARLRLRLNAVSITARNGLKSFLTGKPAPYLQEEEGTWLHGDFSQEQKKRQETFENHLTYQDKSGLAALLKRAKDQETQVVFIAFPKAQSSQGLHLNASHLDVRQAIENLARELKRPLFAPALLWPDNQFSDRIHLNADGRKRYLAELHTWLQTQ